VGGGIGGRLKAGKLTGTIEIAAKINVSFSTKEGKLAVSRSVDVGAHLDAGKKKIGLGVSAEQVAGSVNVGTGETHGEEPATGEWTLGSKTGGTERTQTTESIGVEGEGGEGLVGGGGISITKEGLGKLNEAWNDLHEILKPSPPPPPAPPPAPPH
jgi:hypothetical protein